MLANKSLIALLAEVSSSSPAPGGGSVAAVSGAFGAALTAMVCNLTIGKKKYADVESEMKKILAQADELRTRFVSLIDQDTDAFNKVMEAYGLPRDTEPHNALRNAAIKAATKEATLVPLAVMKHCIDALALAREAAAKGNARSVSDAGVSARMLEAACGSAALNVRINLRSLDDQEFVGWKTDEVQSLENTSKKMLEEILTIVEERIRNPA